MTNARACGTISEGVGFYSYNLKEGLKKGITHVFDKFIFPKKQAVAKHLDGLKVLLLDMKIMVDNDLVGKKTQDEEKNVAVDKGKGGKDDDEKNVTKGNDKG